MKKVMLLTTVALLVGWAVLRQHRGPALSPSAAAAADLRPPKIWDERLQYDFEGATTDGWFCDAKQPGATACRLSPEARHSGRQGLAVDFALQPRRPDGAGGDHSSGAAVVLAPGDYSDGRTISAWVLVPWSLAGDRSASNGIRFAVQQDDQNWNSQYSPWLNARDVAGKWVRLELKPTARPDAGMTTSAGFDPTRVLTIMVVLGLNDNARAGAKGTLLIDDVAMVRRPFKADDTAQVYSPLDRTPESQRLQPFAERPTWDADPEWRAEGTGSVTQEGGCLRVKAAFGTEDDAHRKLFVGARIAPRLDLKHADHRRFTGRLRFDPPLDPYSAVVSLFILDERAGDTPDGWRWHKSRDLPVGSAVWQPITWDLADPRDWANDDPRFLPLTGGLNALRCIVRVGLQVWWSANNRGYDGTVMLDDLALGGRRVAEPPKPQPKVTRRGTALEADGRPFRFAGVNNYSLVYMTHPQVDDFFKECRQLGVRVVRTWGFMDGLGEYVQDGDHLANGNEGVALQPERGSFDRRSFLNLEYVLDAANVNCVYLILPLANYWSDKYQEEPAKRANSFGGVSQYLEWCGLPLTYHAGLLDEHRFYVEEATRQAYADYVTYTVRRLRNKPAVLAFELMNEPRCPEDASGETLLRWVGDMAQLVHRLDPSRLVGVGDEGMLRRAGSADKEYSGVEGVDGDRLAALDGVDYLSVHMYVEPWGHDVAWGDEWIRAHVDLAARSGKPVIFEEYGLHRDPKDPAARPAVYAKWMRAFQAPVVAGDCVWMLATPGETQDFDGYALFPGSPELEVLKAHAVAMAGGQG